MKHHFASTEVNGGHDGDYWVADLSQLGKIDLITQEDLDGVKVVPNPFIVQSAFGGGEDRSLRFTHLPTMCRISIYTISGEFVALWIFVIMGPVMVHPPLQRNPYYGSVTIHMLEFMG